MSKTCGNCRHCKDHDTQFGQCKCPLPMQGRHAPLRMLDDDATECQCWAAHYYVPNMQGCVCYDPHADDRLRLRADTAAKVAVEWKKLFNERNRLWREEADRVGAVKLLLEANGCDCDCDHDAESHDSDCDRCLACRISWAVET